jgi:predicted ATPase
VITRIEALNYRCLRYVAQNLGPFHVLAGPNGSGKSSFLDVPVIMRDIVQDGLQAAISKRVPDYSYLFWLRRGNRFELSIEAAIPASLARQNLHLSQLRDEADEEGGQPTCRYLLAVGTMPRSRELGILAEQFTVGHRVARRRQRRGAFPGSPRPPATILKGEGPGWSTIVAKRSGSASCFHAETGDLDREAYAFTLLPAKSALANLPDDDSQFPVAVWFKNHVLGRTRTVLVNPAVVRLPCPKGWDSTIRPDGGNLSWLVEQLDNASRREWVGHLQTALPDLRDVTTFLREEDATRYVKLHYDNGAEVRSWLVSDGTLAMMALTILAYLPKTDYLYLIEEPENAIHPTALETVYQSLRSVYDGQVLVATHSPELVTMTELEHLLCLAKSKEGATDIVAGPEHPHLRHWRHEVSLGTYLAGGVLG